MLILIAIVMLVSISAYVFFNMAPQIGGEAKGARLERMKNDPYFKNGVFVNTVETNMDMPWSTISKVLRHYLFEDKSHKIPQETIETKPFKADAFNSLNDSTIGITWLGHSSILIKISGMTILTDPVLEGERASMFSFMGPERFSYEEYVGVEDLPKIDAVIISHDHYDHLDYATITLLKEKVDKFYMPLGVGAHFIRWGIPESQIVELAWWDEIDLGVISLALTPTRHFSGRAIRDRFKTLWGSWVIIGIKRRIYFSGDSGYFPGFKEIGEKYGPFDLTFMECGAYNEGWSEIHMFPEQTAQAHLDVKGNLLMPIHWGKFDLALHPWKESVQRLRQKAELESIPLFTPEIGAMILYSDQPSTDYWWEKYK